MVQLHIKVVCLVINIGIASLNQITARQQAIHVWRKLQQLRVPHQRAVPHLTLAHHTTIDPILDAAHIAAPSGIGLVHQISSHTANIDITIMVNIKRGLTKVSHIYVIISIKNLTYNIVTVIVQKCQRQKMLFQYVPLEVKCNQYHASGMIHISV